MTPLQLVAPIVVRCDTSHCWVRRPGQPPGHIDAPFTDKQFAAHLSDGYAYGLCPMHRGSSTTRLALLDLDSHKGETSWQEMLDASAKVVSALALYGLEVTTFKSSGGQGVHLYMAWAEPQDAYSVREVLKAALLSVGFAPGIGGVANKEIEIFPKQDAISPTGFGSMFILPLAGASSHLAGDWALADAIPVLTKPERPHHDSSITADFKTLRSALAAILNEGSQERDYDEWRTIVFGIHDASDGSDYGLSLAHEFSQRASKYDPGFLDHRVWPYITKRDGGITARSIFAIARKHGWVESIEDQFEVLADEQPGQTPTSAPSQEGHAAGVATSATRFQVVPLSQFSQGDPAEWIIQDVLPRAQLAVVYGESGSGKSFFALDMVAAIARGVPWRDHDVAKGRCVYIAAEGAHGLRNRSKGYILHAGIELTAVDDLGVIADAPNLMIVDDVKDLIRSIGKADVVVMDTFSNVMPGANENSGEDVGKALAHCRQISKWTGAMVVLVHHSGKDAAKGARGWSGLRAACDCEIEIIRIGNDRAATITKQKDGEDGSEFGFKLGLIEVGFDAKNRPVGSCFIEHVEASPKQTRGRNSATGRVQLLVLRIAQDVADLAGGSVPVDTLLEEVVRHMPHADGTRDNRVTNAKRALEMLAEKQLVSILDDVVTVAGLA